MGIWKFTELQILWRWHIFPGGEHSSASPSSNHSHSRGNPNHHSRSIHSEHLPLVEALVRPPAQEGRRQPSSSSRTSPCNRRTHRTLRNRSTRGGAQARLTFSNSDDHSLHPTVLAAQQNVRIHSAHSERRPQGRQQVELLLLLLLLVRTLEHLGC